MFRACAFFISNTRQVNSSGEIEACVFGNRASSIFNGGQLLIGICQKRPLTPLNSLTAGGKDFLVFTLTLPSAAPGNVGKVAACSGTSGGTESTENLEGCSSTLTYTFQAVQRNATAQ